MVSLEANSNNFTDIETYDDAIKRQAPTIFQPFRLFAPFGNHLVFKI